MCLARGKVNGAYWWDRVNVFISLKQSENMNEYLLYGVIAVLLFVLEVVYFRVAARFNIIDKPNERSSHSSVVLRGGGVIFLLGVWLWCIFFGFHYPLFLVAVTLAAGISFVDDIHSLPDSVRLVVQFVAMGLMIGQIFLTGSGDFAFGESLLARIAFVVIALIVCVGRRTSTISWTESMESRRGIRLRCWSL